MLLSDFHWTVFQWKIIYLQPRDYVMLFLCHFIILFLIYRRRKPPKQINETQNHRASANLQITGGRQTEQTLFLI